MANNNFYRQITESEKQELIKQYGQERVDRMLKVTNKTINRIIALQKEYKNKEGIE